MLKKNITALTLLAARVRRLFSIRRNRKAKRKRNAYRFKEKKIWGKI
jgi:hypothetical protein